MRILVSLFGKENLYRFGGDEFIAVMGNTTAAEMERLFRKLEEALAEENKTDIPYRAPLSISKGYSTFNPGEDAE